ncbi:MAG: nucleoside 2-deoxyribosyltransferase [Magnetovibrio sp.]|nr:nucleoside 2-deoxyribosyltransferase [Magnetovibrio sp.]
MKVYLAGPDVFFPDAKAHGERLKATCVQYGLEGVFPLDANLDLIGLSKSDAANAIYKANVALIDGCDALIANMTPFRGVNMDTGTAFEMGYAKAQGKVVVGYSENPALYLDRVKSGFSTQVDEAGELRDGDGLVVEDFGLTDNLMMVCGAEFVGATFEETAHYLQQKLA